jgi:cytochrome P450
MDFPMNDTAPIGIGIRLEELKADPYPIYERLRREEPVSWVASANRFFVTRYKDALFVERNPAIFSSVEQQSMLERAIGPMMLRLDGAEHRRIRKVLEPVLSVRAVRDQWTQTYRRIVSRHIDGLAERGQAELMADFCEPCAAECLAALLGLKNAAAADLVLWSKCVIEGAGNYADDPAIWRRNDAAFQRFDAGLAEMCASLRDKPDDSILSAMVNSDQALTFEEIRSNLLVIIGGGLNEPRDAIGTAVFGLLTHPDQRSMAENEDGLWGKVFEEAVRWVSPVGMYPRQVTSTVELSGVRLDPGARIGVLIGSANRDEEIFAESARFDIRRSKNSHLAFGGGAHYCLGVWASRTLVGGVVLPELFRRLPELSLSPTRPVTWEGWVFRGPTSLPVEWRAG